MGKNKKKGKAKSTPSSSRRSAELLSSAGAAASPAMIGFQNYSLETSGLSTPGGNLEEDSNGNVRLIVKTMLKKDVVTKLKGIQEFIACCSNDSETVLQFLPHFPRIYNKLAVDTDLRVRQAIQEALEMYVPLLKKDMTPYLKNIMATWVITMADPCVGAATAARSAFLKSFPESKQSDALMFCQSEILNVICDNLCKSNEETPNVARSLTEDVYREKHELILICSVRGLKLFVSLLSEDDKRKVIQPVSVIVNDKRFWAHSQSTIRKVRVAWYELINILVSELSEVFQDTKDLILLVISSLWKGDSQVIRSIWDCALQVFFTFKDWWCQIDVSSMMFIPLLEFLSSGGYGNATVVYPVLPEFLCHLLAVDSVGLNFIMKFFNSLRKSFSMYKLKSSQKECDAVMLGFMECLKFVSGMLLEDQGQLNESRELIEKQLIPLIRYSFKSEGLNIAATSFYALLGLYLQDLEASVYSKPTKTQDQDENQDDDDECYYCNILAYIWENISAEITSYLKIEVEGRQKDANVLILFFHSLHQPSKYLEASERKLYFYGESCSIPNDDNYFVVGNSSNIISRAKSPAACDTSFLFNYTVGFCEYLCAQLERNLRACYLELFAEVISDANCEQTFCEMLQALHVPVSSAARAPFIFFQTVTMDWMRCASISQDDVSLDWIKDIIMCICFCVTADCAVVILDICSQFPTGKLFQRLLVQMLEYTESCEEFICRWFHSPTFACVLESTAVTCMRMLTHQNMRLDNSEVALSTKALMLAFANAGSEDPQIPWAPIRKILVGFSSIMDDAPCTRCEFMGDYNMIDFTCDAAEKLFFQHPSSCLTEKETSAFVFRAFALSLEWTMDDSSDTHKEQRQLDNLWKTFVPSAIVKPSDLNKKNFLIMAAQHLHDLLLKGLSKKKQEHHVVEVICIFLELAEAAYSNMQIDKCESESVFLFLLKIIMPLSTEWEQARHELHMGTVAEILKNNFFYPFVKQNLPICSVAVPRIVFLADAVVELVLRMLFLVTENCSPQVQELYHKRLCHEHLPHILWTVCYADNEVFFKAQDIKEPVIFTALKAKYSYLIKRCNIYHFVTVIALRLFKDHETWAVPFDKVLQLVARETGRPLAYFPSFYPSFEVYKRNHLSLTQSCLKHADMEFVEGFLSRINVDLFNQEYDNMMISAFSGAVSQVAICIEYHGHALLPTTQKKVSYFLKSLTGSKWFHEYNHEENPLLVTCFTSIVVGVMKNAPAVVSLDLWISVIQIVQEWFQKCLAMTYLALNDTTRLIFVQKTCRLISIMSEVVQGLDQEVNAEACDYWRTVFESDISKQLVNLFADYAGKISHFGHTSDALERLLFALVQNFEYLTTEQIFEGVIFMHCESSTKMNLSERIDVAHKVLHHEFAHHLKSKSMCVQFGSHFLLKKMLVHLTEIDQRQKVFADSEHEGAFKALPLVDLMEHTNELIKMVLEEMPTECCVLEPCTDSFTFAMANLLAWDIFFEYFSAFVTEEHSVYLGCLADSKMLSCMLMNVIRLRPEHPSACSGHIPSNRGDDEQKVDLHEMPPLYSLGTPSLKHLQHAACSVYVTALKKIPALVRTWWSNLEKRIADSVERFTSAHISKVLILNEMKAIESYKEKFNMLVDAYPSSRQVIATYALDDTTIELTVKIPHNYPLGPVSATSTKKNIVEPAQWRAWMLQMSKFLNYHNGSIKNAIVLWKQNLDKKFEGVEECMICFFVLQSSSGTLPNKTCRVCKKKFHGTCLFKWFKTSNSCSCPGCRTDF